MNRLSEVGSLEEQLAYARNAFLRYPSDYEIREQLAVCLYFMWQQTHDTSLIGEIENLLKTVMDECVNENTRYDAITKLDRKSTRLNSSHVSESRMPSSA
mgnify:CR=1 FL=1